MGRSGKKESTFGQVGGCHEIKKAGSPTMTKLRDKNAHGDWSRNSIVICNCTIRKNKR